MLIVSQDRQYQTENIEMVIAPEVNSEGETGRYEILSHNEYCLGVYKNLGIAIEVMHTIRQAFGMVVFTNVSITEFDLKRLKIENPLFVQTNNNNESVQFFNNGIFYMPLENQ